ncbi:hypothetical protein QJS10_CPA03g01814 [Acorus calamus]|uniref:Uncharacterized protein n=1 Tax=Acorus calamus TaxID=4465 RepID=A0AAV9F764_ACOCL|nr:hypothetical protein QJS10_CPA03g01814 [Acorus calamus]
MRKLCPNFDREDGLDTVLEVPIPEETFARPSSGGGHRRHVNPWTNVKSWVVRPNHHDKNAFLGGTRSAELQLLLGVIGAPLVPLPIRADRTINRNIKDHPIESSMAKYIVQQYIAAAGGEKALDAIDSMYAMGKVRMAVASEFSGGGDRKKGSKGGGEMRRRRNGEAGGGEMGGFVLWRKKPDLWCLELVVSGCKISAGSDGKVAWRQTPWHASHASRGPPRPLRRSLQGLDPRTTANLFSNAVCIGEKPIDGEDCFVLRLDAEPSILRTRSSSAVEILRHTVWGYFGQRTGLLVRIEDSHLLRIRTVDHESSVYWETSMESSVGDYRPIDGVQIAHAGRTWVTLARFGEGGDGDGGGAQTRMEETWAVEEVDFNVRGLSIDCFLPPGDLKRDNKENNNEGGGGGGGALWAPPGLLGVQEAVKLGLSKVVAAVGLGDSDSSAGGSDEDERLD